MTLDKIISKYFDIATLGRIVYDQDVITAKTYDKLFKNPGLDKNEIAQQTVDLYGDKASTLAKALQSEVWVANPEAGAELVKVLDQAAKGAANVRNNFQASLSKYAPTLPMTGLRRFLNAVTGQICLIVARPPGTETVERGTGFLVAPDLVLTCRHVMKGFPPNNPLPAGSAVEIYFDFEDGDPVQQLNPELPTARKVALAQDWYVTHCDNTHPDGCEKEVTPEHAEQLAKSLDFILLRLSERVGTQAIEVNGSRPRGWVEFASEEVPRNLQTQDWIIIPQHPNGAPQRIDLGRYAQLDQTGTRIRYNTNTDNGTSGAPCFNQNFRLVGLHNAYVGPKENPIANQAIRFDLISTTLRPFTAAKASGALLWSVAPAGKPPQVILGRDCLLKWLSLSQRPDPVSLAQRVYAARASVPAAGCSFSYDMLVAETRQSSIPRAIYGKCGQQLPSAPEDFLQSLLRELGIAANVAETMPTRPGQAELATEIDKHNAWISKALPLWLGDVLVQCRKDLAYVVIDDLRSQDYVGTTQPRTELKGDVRALIAALVNGVQEQAMHPGLKCLRWMFLGYLPDFLPVTGDAAKDATVEGLDPASFGEQEMRDLVERMKLINPNVVLKDSDVKLCLKVAALSSARLTGLQEAMNEFARDQMK